PMGRLEGRARHESTQRRLHTARRKRKHRMGPAAQRLLLRSRTRLPHPRQLAARWRRSLGVLQPLEKAILIAIDRITRDNYTSTDSDEVANEVKAMGFELPAEMLYERLFLQLRSEEHTSELQS